MTARGAKTPPAKILATLESESQVELNAPGWTHLRVVSKDCWSINSSPKPRVPPVVPVENIKKVSSELEIKMFSHRESLHDGYVFVKISAVANVRQHARVAERKRRGVGKRTNIEQSLGGIIRIIVRATHTGPERNRVIT